MDIVRGQEERQAEMGIKANLLVVHQGATRQELEQARFYKSPKTNRLGGVGVGLPRGYREMQPPLGPTDILLFLTGCKPPDSVPQASGGVGLGGRGKKQTELVPISHKGIIGS